MLGKLKQLKHKKVIISLIVVFVLVGLGLILTPSGFVQAQATVSPGTGDESMQWVAKILTSISMLFISTIGKLLTLFIEQIIGVAQFNQFIDSRAVNIGWVVVRDLANIFFVVIMLTIALGTLFNMQSYEYKKLLPKLMIAVILVNFSKMIVGLAIDVGQVIMLTFVNTFKGVAVGGLVNGLGITSMLELKDAVEGAGGSDSIKYWNIFGSTFLALIMLIVAVVVILALTVVLLFRIIMLWVLIIFSPIAFVASVMPTSPLQKVGFFGQYWTYLSKYIIVGPILAFFLWLSFSIMMHIDAENKQHIITLYKANTASQTEAVDPDYIEYLATKISSPQNMFDYMTTIALLLASLMITQQMGVMGGAMGMNAVNKMKGMATKAAVWSVVGKKDKDGDRKGGLLGGYTTLSRKAKAGKFGEGLKGKDFNPMNWYKNFKESGERNKQKEIIEGNEAAGEGMIQMGTAGLFAAMGSKSGFDKIRQGFMYGKGISSFYATDPEEIEKFQKEVKKNQKEERRSQREAEGKNNGEAMIDDLVTNKDELLQVIKNLDQSIQDLNKPKEEMDEAELNLQVFYEKIKGLRAKGSDKEADKLEREQLPELQKIFTEKQKEYTDNRVSNSNKEQLLIKEKNVKKKDLARVESDLQTAKNDQRIAPDRLAQNANNYWSQKANDVDVKIKNLENGGVTDEQKKSRQNEIEELTKQEDKIKADIAKRNGIAKLPEQELLTSIKAKKQKLARNIATDKENEANEEVIKGLKEDKDNFKAQAVRNYSETEREKKRQEYQKAKAKTKETKAKLQDKVAALPQDYYGRVDAQNKIYEELRKINTTNEDELNTMYKSAENAGDKFLAAATVVKAAMAGHLNEILSDNEYVQNNDGLNQFVNERLIDKLGMNKQWAYSVQNDASNEAERVGHWTFGQSIGYKNGQMEQRDFAEQQLRVKIEMGKSKGKEAMWRDNNRLAWMTEYTDKSTGNRLSVLNPAAITAIKTDYGNILRSIERHSLNPNTAANLVMPKNWAILEAVQRDMSPAERQGPKGFDQMMKALAIYADKKDVISGEGVADKMRHLVDLGMQYRQAGGSPPPFS